MKNHDALEGPAAARLARWLGALFIVALFFGAITMVVAIRYRATLAIVASGLTLTLSLVALVARSLCRRGRAREGALATGAALLVYSLAAGFVGPESGAALFLLPVIAVALALPFCERLDSTWIVLGASACELAIAVVVIRGGRPSPEVPDIVAQAVTALAAAGGAWLTLWLFRDSILGMRDALASSRRNERRLQALAAHRDQLIWTVDTQTGRPEADCPGWRALTGQSVESWLSRGWTAAVHPDDRLATEEAWVGAVRDTRPWVHRCRVQRAEGAVSVIEVSAVPVADPRRPHGEWVMAASDITLRAERERELQTAVVGTEALRRQAGHELKTPLSALTLLVHAIRKSAERGDGLSLSLPRHLELAQRQVHRLTELIDLMLDRPHPRREDLHPSPSSVSLRATVEAAITDVHPLLERAGSSLELTVHEDIEGHWDVERLRQALVNLLTNAAKFGAGRPVEVEVCRRGDRAVVSVRDHGVGIAPSEFERAERAERVARGEGADSHRAPGGSGIGLWIVREVIVAHGGEVRVASEPGYGARFELELPVSPMADTTAVRDVH